MDDSKQRKQNAMIGLAIGDAIGWTSMFHRSFLLPPWTRRKRREIDMTSETENVIVLKIKSTAADSYQMNFNALQDISQILFDNNEVAVNSIGNKHSIVLDPFEGEKDLTIKLK